MTEEIESGIPLPPSHQGRKSGRVNKFRSMQVGDSLFIAVAVKNRAGGILGQAKRALPGTKWTTRRAEKDGVTGIRIWRVE